MMWILRRLRCLSTCKRYFPVIIFFIGATVISTHMLLSPQYANPNNFGGNKPQNPPKRRISEYLKKPIGGRSVEYPSIHEGNFAKKDDIPEQDVDNAAQQLQYLQSQLQQQQKLYQQLQQRLANVRVNNNDAALLQDIPNEWHAEKAANPNQSNLKTQKQFAHQQQPQQMMQQQHLQQNQPQQQHQQQQPQNNQPSLVSQHPPVNKGQGYPANQQPVHQVAQVQPQLQNQHIQDQQLQQGMIHEQQGHAGNNFMQQGGAMQQQPFQQQNQIHQQQPVQQKHQHNPIYQQQHVQMQQQSQNQIHQQPIEQQKQQPQQQNNPIMQPRDNRQQQQQQQLSYNQQQLQQQNIQQQQLQQQQMQQQLDLIQRQQQQFEQHNFKQPFNQPPQQPQQQQQLPGVQQLAGVQQQLQYVQPAQQQQPVQWVNQQPLQENQRQIHANNPNQQRQDPVLNGAALSKPIPDVIAEGIVWSQDTEAMTPSAYTWSEVDDWSRRVRSQVITAMIPGDGFKCGVPPNQYAVLADGTQLCVRHRFPHTIMIHGEIYSFYLGRMLDMKNIPQGVLSLVDVNGVNWGKYGSNFNSMRWQEGKYVVLSKFVDDLESNAFYPKILLGRESKGPILATSPELSYLTPSELTYLVQWTDLVILDYLVGHIDRITNHQEGAYGQTESTKNMIYQRQSIHNLGYGKSSGILWFIDNESGFRVGYSTLYTNSDQNNKNKYNNFHEETLRSTCIFRRTTVDKIQELYQNANPWAVLKNFVDSYEPLTNNVQPVATENFDLYFNERVGNVYRWMQECRLKN